MGEEVGVLVLRRDSGLGERGSIPGKRKEKLKKKTRDGGLLGPGENCTLKIE
jgi:hypothetical protein